MDALMPIRTPKPNEGEQWKSQPSGNPNTTKGNSGKPKPSKTKFGKLNLLFCGLLGCSWVPLGCFLGPLGCLLRPLGSLLGASWGLLAASWGLLGVSWEPLGSFLERFGRVFDACWILASILGAKRGPKGRHFGSPKGSKIDPKLRCKFKSENITSWSRLGSILARFGVRLGVENIENSLVFTGFRENLSF